VPILAKKLYSDFTLTATHLSLIGNIFYIKLFSFKFHMVWIQECYSTKPCLKAVCNAFQCRL